MANDKSKRIAADWGRVAAGEPYGVGYFARKDGITRELAGIIIKRAGGDRAGDANPYTRLLSR